LNYGEGSLLAVRELNVRRTFDGIKAIFNWKQWRIDALAFKAVPPQPGVFDDSRDPSQTLWGVWAVKKNESGSFIKQWDAYYLGLDRKQARFDQGAARDQRHTVGFVLHTERGPFSSFMEATLQFGRFGEGDIRAWKYDQKLTYSFKSAPLRPVVSLLGAISSGDKNRVDPDLQTFHPLFPKGLYYGYIDDSGSLNAIVLHPQVVLRLSQNISLTLDHYSFWRQRTGDGLYLQPGTLLRSGRGTDARYVGSLQDFSLQWQVNRHTRMEIIGTYYEVGPFLRQTPPPGRDLTYLSAKVSYRF
jgi:hypothetical protein